MAAHDAIGDSVFVDSGSDVAVGSYAVDESRLGAAYALMTLIRQTGFFSLHLLIGMANDSSRASADNPGGYALGMRVLSVMGFIGVFFAIMLRRFETGPGSHGLRRYGQERIPENPRLRPPRSRL